MTYPSVNIRELDLTETIPVQGSTVGAIVGGSGKGLVGVKFITNEGDFIANYGKPVPGNYFHYSALSFLRRGNSLYCRRVVSADALFGGVCVNKTGTTPTAVTLSAGEVTPKKPDSGYADAAFFVFAVNPGSWNSTISVKVVENTEDASWFTLQVYETTGGVTSLVESWEVSRVSQLDGFGKQVYLENRINGFSKYIVVVDNTVLSSVTMPAYMSGVVSLGGGANGTAVGNSEIIEGWEDFASVSNYDVNLLINGGHTEIAVQAAMRDLAISRADCMALLDVPMDSSYDYEDMIEFRAVTQNFNTKYSALFGPWVSVYDKYNDVMVDIPPSGEVAGTIVYNNSVGRVWTSAAGLNRGVLNVLGVTNKLSEAEGELLVKNQINPIMYFRGEGIVLWTQLTQQKKSSADSLMSVRFLIMMMRKSIGAIMRTYLHEPNSTLTRLRVSGLLEGYLGVLASQGAFQVVGDSRGYSVVCNDVNNTSASIARGELNVSVVVSVSIPVVTINLTIVNTPAGTSIEELVSQGVIA